MLTHDIYLNFNDYFYREPMGLFGKSKKEAEKREKVPSYEEAKKQTIELSKKYEELDAKVQEFLSKKVGKKSSNPVVPFTFEMFAIENLERLVTQNQMLLDRSNWLARIAEDIRSMLEIQRTESKFRWGITILLAAMTFILTLSLFF